MRGNGLNVDPVQVKWPSVGELHREPLPVTGFAGLDIFTDEVRTQLVISARRLDFPDSLGRDGLPPRVPRTEPGDENGDDRQDKGGDRDVLRTGKTIIMAAAQVHSGIRAGASVRAVRAGHHALGVSSRPPDDPSSPGQRAHCGRCGRSGRRVMTATFALTQRAVTALARACGACLAGARGPALRAIPARVPVGAVPRRRGRARCGRGTRRRASSSSTCRPSPARRGPK
jgi:hypothetical protein